MSIPIQENKIIIAGAGPGHPDLVTVRTANYLQKADIIITDRLVGPQILQRYAPATAQIIYAGKEGHSGQSTTQQSINQLMVSLYNPGKLLLRLKGGDVAFFSNVLDELETLRRHNIPYEIVPGITAASAASAYAGIPLTARGYTKNVRFHSFLHPHDYSEATLTDWANTGDSLVFYMSSRQLPVLAELLLLQGAAPQKPLAVIEQASTPFQQVHLTTLQQAAVHSKKYQSPSLIIIGDVVNLHQKFHWYGHQPTGQYFSPALSQPTHLNI